MKKILLTIFTISAIFVSSLCASAQTGVTFVYINGSNNNDKKMKNWYENGVKKLHPCLKAAFENNPHARQYFLKNGKYFIENTPKIFFWGYRSKEDLSFVEQNLAISRGLSPWVAYQVRSMITHFLHDAIWVQKYHNMLPVINDLHDEVKQEAEKGNNVVLYGYSAGSFVTYQYLLTRLPFITVEDFFNNVKVPNEQKEFAKQHKMKNTCMAALGTELAVFSASGHIVLNNDKDSFEQKYLNLDNITDSACVPENTVRGVVNFASPLVLFYSDLSDPTFELTYYNRLLFEYLLEHDMFWITVNYREDPLGFPGGRNLSIEEIEDIANLDIDPHKGFMYDHSGTWGRNTVLTAHTSYWSNRKNFSRAVVKAYVNGYRHQYDDSYKKKHRK